MAVEEEPTDWVEAEEDAHTFRTELQRIKRRAKRRPILLVLLCLLGTGAVLFKLSRRVTIHKATIVMRVTEGAVAEDESPVVRQGLASYLYTVALNSERLMPIIEKFNLYPQRETRGDIYAIGKIRDQLDIKVGVNEFARVRDDGDPVRSAGISIHFSSVDPQLAFDIAQELSAALVVAEQERRSQTAQKLNAIANTTVERIEARLSDLKIQLARAMIAVNVAEKNQASALEKVKLDLHGRRLSASVTETETILEGASWTRDNTTLAIAAEGANQALRFVVIDVVPPLIAPETSVIGYCLLGLFIFLCLIPVSAIGIGALDTRLHHIEDLVRLGLPVVGHMPSFPSDRMGSMHDRSRQAKDVA